MIVALLLRVGDSGQRGQEALRGVDHVQSHPGRRHEVLLDLFRLTGAQQAVVDEDTGELVADRPVHEGGGDRRVHPAAEAADDPGVAHGLAHPRDLLLDDVGGRPRGLNARDLVEEALQDPLTVRRVHHLGVELHAGPAVGDILERRHRRPGRAGGHGEPRRGHGDRVAVAHPHRLVGRQVPQQLTAGDLQRGRPVLPLPGAGHLAAQRLGHRLEAVADAEHGHPGREQRGVHLRGAGLVDARRSPGEDHRRRVAREQLPDRHRVGHDLGVDPRLPHPTRDQLRVLRTEIDDEHRPRG